MLLVEPPAAEGGGVPQQHEGEQREHKRPRVDGCPSSLPPPVSTLEPVINRLLLQGTPFPPPLPRLPDSADDRHELLAQYFQAAGLRTSLVSSPQAAVSIYVDEDREVLSTEHESVWVMLGLHPRQVELETLFVVGGFRERVRVMAFAARMLKGLPAEVLEVVGRHLKDLEEDDLSDRLHHHQQHAEGRGGGGGGGAVASKSAQPRVASIIATICAASREQRPERLEKEAQRLRWRYSSLASTLLQGFNDLTGLTLGDAVFRPSASPRMTRLTLVPWTETVGGRHPGPFIFMPGLATVLKHGPEALVSSMLSSFWSHIWRFGYYPGEGAFKAPVSEHLVKFFRSGIIRNGRTPLRAGFEPQHFLSLYLHGLAGAGKSSFIAKFVPALSATLEEALDPELDVRFVKQNLNKTYGELNQELTLRPNNNDLSVMSIIQGRRMTLSSSKPGLVVVGLEEVPPADPHRELEEGPVLDPDIIEQVANLRLLANRFSGMTGESMSAAQRTRLLQQNRGGISDHTTLVAVFTSNYPLHERSRAMLSALPMFSNLLELNVTAIEHDERRAFSLGFLRHMVEEALAKCSSSSSSSSLSLGEVILDVNLDHGDIRDLVRRLHVIGFFVSQVAKSLKAQEVHLTIKHSSEEGGHVEVYLSRAAEDDGMKAERGDDKPWVRLTGLTDRLLLPIQRPVVDERSRQVVGGLPPGQRQQHGEVLGHVLDYFFHGVLTPAVIVSKSRALLSSLVDRLVALPCINSLRGVDAATDRIVKSLYEGSEVRCLRDDIKNFRRSDPEAMVLVEVEATSREAQLRIRELIEDTPSMIAFSTARSALKKKGLFFTILVDDDITPELQSRASIVLLD